MDFVKSHWGVEGERVSLQMPIAKIDEEKRLVSGFATLDNVDQSDDVVLASASKTAFQRFRGNIREMHEPIAAGRLVDFKEDSFYDSKTEKFYRGIWVTTYVSKGAENTWLKILDGTLSGFSIGGSIVDSETQFSKDDQKPIRFIKEYDLNELSYVDSPCNQFSNIFSIQKNSEGTFIKGMVAETHLVNIFWCPEHEIAKNSESETEVCLVDSCGRQMENIGWVEKGDEVGKMQGVVTKFLRQKEDNAVTKQTDNTGEGGVEKMTDEDKKDGVVTSEDVTAETDEKVEEVKTEGSEVVTNAGGDEETGKVDVEKAEEVATEPNFEKLIDDLKGSVNESVEKAIKAAEAHVEQATKTFDEKASELEKGLSDLRDELKKVSDSREGVEKRLGDLEKATAIKKSGDVETEPEKKLQKGLWSGALFDRNDVSS